MGLTLRVGQRTPKGLGPEIVHERLGTGAIGRAIRFAGKQSVLVTVSKCVASQTFRDLSIQLGQGGRDDLCRGLVGVSVDVVFRREVARGSGAVAQQVSHGVVVLHVRKPADRFEPAFGRGILGGFVVEVLGSEILHPAAQQAFFLAVGGDEGAARVRDPVGWLEQERRLADFRLVHEAP